MLPPCPVTPADAGTHGCDPGDDCTLSPGPPCPWVPAFAGMTEGACQKDGGRAGPSRLPPLRHPRVG
ncbi:hypothetical protein SPHINGO391_440117 [Sphingomonas aurantiaca]|uniref:Uncharacterized protein n=1 Tax=Sphingomonas aurantiaca TaxID=185949 RepID=A0A5E7Z7Z7_9SPHN|nr:hypothetical protein SPHINGO391_440117 [Sphingomonas aurantiaca]